MGTQQNIVSRVLKFTGIASYTDNIRGNLSYEKVVLYDDFLGGGVDETNDWVVNEDHGGTGAINASSCGTYRLTTSTANNDKMEIANSLIWYASEACIMEARIKIDNAATALINVGWADAAEYSDNQTCFEISSATIVDRCTDGACWVFDTNADDDYWYMCNSLAGVQVGTSYGSAPTAGTYETFRVALDTSGNATFYRNGNPEGFKALAVTTTADLTPYIAVLSRSGSAARNLDIDYIKCWQNRVVDA